MGTAVTPSLPSPIGSRDGGAEGRFVLAGERRRNQQVLGRGGERPVGQEPRRDLEAPALEAARLAVGALAAAHGEPEPDDPDAAVAFLLRDGPEAIPNGLSHEAIRVLSGESAAGGIVTAVRELAEGISRIVADRPYPAFTGGAVR